jgi:hypothetical protein
MQGNTFWIVSYYILTLKYQYSEVLSTKMDSVDLIYMFHFSFFPINTIRIAFSSSQRWVKSSYPICIIIELKYLTSIDILFFVVFKEFMCKFTDIFPLNIFFHRLRAPQQWSPLLWFSKINMYFQKSHLAFELQELLFIIAWSVIGSMLLR